MVQALFIIEMFKVKNDEIATDTFLHQAQN